MMSPSGAMLLTALVFLLSCTAPAAGLDCYECSGCEEGQRGHPVQCSSSQDACLKVVLGSRIEKSCTHNAACQLGDLEKSLTDRMKDLSSAITGSERGSKGEARVIHCCTSNYCNGAGVAAPPAILLLLLAAPLALSSLMR